MAELGEPSVRAHEAVGSCAVPDVGTVGPRAGEVFGDPKEVFFGARTRTWLRNRSFRDGWFDPAAEQIGQTGLTPHELRHTAASLAVSAGANVKAVQRMLGHASAAVTLDRYADLFEDDFDAVAVALDRAALQAEVGKM